MRDSTRRIAVFFYLAIVGTFIALIIANLFIPVAVFDPWMADEMAHEFDGLNKFFRQKMFYELSVVFSIACGYFGSIYLLPRLKREKLFVLGSLCLVPALNYVIGMTITADPRPVPLLVFALPLVAVGGLSLTRSGAPGSWPRDS